MEVPYRSFLSSPPFLIIGPNGQKFYVHSNLIAQHSKALDCHVNSGMKEANERLIKIKDLDGDIDDGTVMRFVEYAYTGDYTLPPPSEREQTQLNGDLMEVAIYQGLDQSGQPLPQVKPAEEVAVDEEIVVYEATSAPESEPEPEPEPPLEPEVPSEPEPEPAYLHTGYSRRYSKKGGKRRKPATGFPVMTYNEWVGSEAEAVPKRSGGHVTVASRKQQLWETFVSEAVLLRKEPWEPRKNDHTFDDYTFDLLSHARLYVFSNRYQCSGLAVLSLQKLRLTLSRLDHSEDLSAVTELIHYTYEHTHEHDRGSDKLRLLVIEYAVCHLEKLFRQKKFRIVLGQDGAFAVDLMTKSMQRLEG